MFALITDALFSALPTHKRSSRSRALKLEKPPQKHREAPERFPWPPPGLHPRCAQLLPDKNPVKAVPPRPDGLTPSLGFVESHTRFSPSGEGLREWTRLLIGCAGALFPVTGEERLILEEKLPPRPPDSRSSPQPGRRPPVLRLYLLNNACKRRGNAVPQQINSCNFTRGQPASVCSFSPRRPPTPSSGVAATRPAAGSSGGRV